MEREKLKREIRREALARMEAAARTEADFKAVVKEWNHLDRNRQRRERLYEIGRADEEMLYWDRMDENDEKGRMKEGLDTVIPSPLNHVWWRQLMRGDFIDVIYDNAYEMWQLIEDGDISFLVQSLTTKQKEVLFLRAIGQCTAAQIALCHDKTDRAVRKLLVAALDSVQDRLALLIRRQIEMEYPQMTYAKREFLAGYDKEKAAALDAKNGK